MARQSKTFWHRTRVAGTQVAVYRLQPEAGGPAQASYIAIREHRPWLGAVYSGAEEPTLITLAKSLEQWRLRLSVYLTSACSVLVFIGWISSHSFR